jgi:DNA polymerase-1
MGERFRQIIACDFEYEVAEGDLPNPLAMVAHVLEGNFRHLRTIKLWRGEFPRLPPFDIGPDTLFVSYSAWAEMMCFEVLGWKFPTYIFDQHTAYLAASNRLLPHAPDEERKKDPKNFEAACAAFGIKGWHNIDKDDISRSIGDGSWRWKYSPEEVLAYCEEDVRKSVELLQRQLRGYSADYLPAADVERQIHWAEYSAKVIPQIQARGMYVDLPLWQLAQEYKPAIVRRLIERFDPSHGTEEPIYTEEGEASYRRAEKWLASVGINDWPRHDNGELDLSSDAFRLMYSSDPRIEGWHALRDSLGFIQKARLPIGKDSRNRPSLFPFGTATGRNAHRKSPYNTSAGMRSFLICPPGAHIQYLDWRSQEVGVAAFLSGDEVLKSDYAGGDVYHGLAVMCGKTNSTDPIAWKADHGDQRDQMKPLELGLRYGMSIASLARGLGMHPCQAAAILQKHQARYPRFWSWRREVVENAMVDRVIRSHHTGWPLHLTMSPNKRTLMNFPMQSGGAEMLRLAAVRLCAAGIVPVMLIHDGILFEESDPEKLAQARKLMLDAGRDVCEGFEIGVDHSTIGVDDTTGKISKKVLSAGERYRDKRPMAQKLWTTVMGVLEEIGAVPKRATRAA